MKSTHKLEMVLDAELFEKSQAVAEAKGLVLSSVIEQALRDFVEENLTEPSDAEVMRYYKKSVEQYRTVYERLAK